MSHAPAHQNVQSNLRKISIPVGMCLESDLDNSDDGSQHNQIPKPPGKHIRPLFSPKNGGDADADDCGEGEHNLPRRQLIDDTSRELLVCRMRIKQGEV